MTAANEYVVRAARPGDLATLIEMRALVGPGFTSLAIDDALLAERLGIVARSFSAPVQAPGDERYILLLEHAPTGAIAGLAQVKAVVGVKQPFFNFRILKISAASAAARRRYDMDVLILVNECAGCTEVGTLFVRAEHRVGGLGRMLAQARYMLMAAEPARFAPRVVSELRGFSTPEGVSPFWEHLGRHFFRMSFTEADNLSATTDNQFILDLMPKYPIYVDLLEESARAVIGQCHPEGEGARRLLEREGFRYERVIDIFDGGPLLSSPRDAIATVRGARVLTLRAGAPERPTRVMVSTPQVSEFRCAAAMGEARGDEAVIPAADIARLGLQDGARVLTSWG